MKTEIGINGEHRELGLELSMAEFKGYTVKALSDIEKRLDKMETNCSKCKEDYEKRIGALESFRTYLLAFAGGLGLAGGLLWEAIRTFLLD